MRVRFDEVAVLPEPGDNAAIVSRRLDARTEVELPDGTAVTLPHTVLEGHRFIVRRVAADEPLLSWSTPFARAARDLDAGDYVCTPTSLKLLRDRGVTGLPAEPAAQNVPLDPYRLDETALRLGNQVAGVEHPATFQGFAREGGPGGTRNHIVLVGVTSRSGGFVTELASRFPHAGVVAVAHTEGGEERTPNNLEFLLRTLAGFLVHPNVGAVLIVDSEGDAVTSAHLKAFMTEHAYPPIRVSHAFFTRRSGFESDLSTVATTVAEWVEPVTAKRRTEIPLEELRIALQCGGSDAFSGISANPLAGAVSREVIRHGGAAVLAETDELIGAEGYVLENVRDVATARKFLEAVRTFQDRVGWHGHTAEGNPSGGNVYRGLVNVVLKSVGAARKRDRQLRLDHVIDYGELLPGPGFTFMDSPGNDLESVAGEVAAGCNLVFFTTGNGSITNFPFVPTLKFVTTTPRFELLRHEMDVDAGRYLTGTPMDELTSEVFDLTVAIASGRPTAGETAAHSQVSIWREWRQTRSKREWTPDDHDIVVGGQPLDIRNARVPPELDISVDLTDGATEQIGLILPTSLCSGQIAARLAATAERERWAGEAVTRYAALPHTEGCGSSGGASEETYARTMVGYLTHPNVRLALLLEHGCEKTHNDYFRSRLVEAGVDPKGFGWASIQTDGGIDAVSARVRDWFAATSLPAPRRTRGTIGDLTIGLDSRGPTSDEAAETLRTLGEWIVGAGGNVIVPSATHSLRRLIPSGSQQPISRDPKVSVGGKLEAVGREPESTLAYGERPRRNGWHVMRIPGTDWLETATGFGAGGAQLIITHVTGGTLSGHRLVPVLQFSSDAETQQRYGDDLDGTLEGTPTEQASAILTTLQEVVAGTRPVKAVASSNLGFQITRGLLGTSM